MIRWIKQALRKNLDHRFSFLEIFPPLDGSFQEGIRIQSWKKDCPKQYIKSKHK
jgi:hypothetical protein